MNPQWEVSRLCQVVSMIFFCVLFISIISRPCVTFFCTGAATIQEFACAALTDIHCCSSFIAWGTHGGVGHFVKAGDASSLFFYTFKHENMTFPLSPAIIPSLYHPFNLVKTFKPSFLKGCYVPGRDFIPVIVKWEEQHWPPTHKARDLWRTKDHCSCDVTHGLWGRRKDKRQVGECW